MELGLIIDGKEKMFKQSTTTFKTMKLAIKYQELMIEQMRYYETVTNAKIDEEVDDSVMDAEKNLEQAVDLIVAYFNNQFTYDEFVSAEFKDINEIYQISYAVMTEILGTKEIEDDLKKSNEPTEEIDTQNYIDKVYRYLMEKYQYSPNQIDDMDFFYTSELVFSEVEESNERELLYADEIQW